MKVKVGDVWFNQTWACLIVGVVDRALRDTLILWDDTTPESAGRVETLHVETVSKHGGWRVFTLPKER